MMRIAIIVDKKGWVQYDRAKVLKNILPFHIEVFTLKDKILYNKFDLVYYSSLYLVERELLQHSIIMSSVTSHKILNNPQLYRLIKKCYRLSANSKILYNILRTEGHSVAYIPNGVDTEFFGYSNKMFNPSSYCIGWVGNIDRRTKNYSIIRKLKKHFPIKEVATFKNKGKKRSRTKMLEFYHSLDFFLVVSSTEGTPNPALEAASCGIPIITTKVGNMPELISQDRGFFIRDNYYSAKAAIEKITQIHPKQHCEYKQNIRKEIEKWDWKNRIKEYSDFFNLR